MSGPTHQGSAWWAAAFLAATLPLASGCTTEAFCFSDCAGETGGSSSSASQGGGGGAGGNLLGGEGGLCINCGGEGGEGGCQITNGGIETCDGIDNDCDGTVDNGPDIDFGSAETCGTCDHNCYVLLTNVDPTTITCTPSSDPGVVPGACSGTCAADYFDLDQNGTCEYYCVLSATDDATCDNLDDDCDGDTDEDVDLCASTTDCGQCGKNCVVLHGTPECVHTGMGQCTPANTQCQISTCDTGWHDLDGVYATGCEYQCSITNGGVEICGDGLDNDCDGLIDGADDLSLDPQIGQPCFGDPDGLCATAAHQGLTACVAGQIACTGANVLKENDTLETCNNVDDDCDGVVDDSPTDAGGSCGQSNVYPCSFGSFQCQNGALTCVGAVNPTTEQCNGVDDDCDGGIDLTGALPPADATGPCDVPPAPPPGATQPCQAGTKACTAGVVTCNGSITAPSPFDGCGDDTNCNGVLENQPDLQTNVNACGSCNNDCYAGAIHSLWSCSAGVCQFQGCEAGYFDLDGDEQCEYACIFNQAQEICNGFDDDCDGQVDEGVIAPSPAQQCGVSPSAMSPECTTGVTVACVGAAWQCTFPAGVCNPTCATAAEVCDTLDNNCDGQQNENVANFGKPCASDDGLPAPGHGACRTIGTFVCNGPSSVTCSATKADCATLPGGCDEACDGVDNDCDGLVDEPFSDPGTEPFYYEPEVVQISPTLWVHKYEASRPDATSTTPGNGNGYYTSAPAGTTLDQTPACSEPGRVPWFNVTPREVEQTCNAMGGFICPTASWQTACRGGANCTWGYNPAGAACTSPFTATKFCNLGVSFDFSPDPGNQDGLLPTASPFLQNCWSPWANPLFDMTGNVREITRSAVNEYRLMGGSFASQTDQGATCGFTFYTVNQTFALYDVGFRCCFDEAPN